MVSVNVAARDSRRLRELIDACGDVRILVSHVGLPGPRRPAAALGRLDELATDPRVRVKVSGLYAIDPRPDHPAARDAVAHVMASFGGDRLLWGSDFSPVLDAGASPVAVPSWLPEVVGSDLERVLGTNLVGVLGICDAHAS